MNSNGTRTSSISPDPMDYFAKEPLPSTKSPHRTYAAPIRTANAVPHLLPVSPHGKLTCSLCPRTFKSQARARAHIRTFRHNYKCTIASCMWSFEAPKDLERHLPTHNVQSRQVFTCSITACPSRRSGTSRITFARRDLLARHMRNLH